MIVINPRTIVPLNIYLTELFEPNKFHWPLASIVLTGKNYIINTFIRNLRDVTNTTNWGPNDYKRIKNDRYYMLIHELNIILRHQLNHQHERFIYHIIDNKFNGQHDDQWIIDQAIHYIDTYSIMDNIISISKTIK